MFTLGNHGHATVIGRRNCVRLLIALFFIAFILTVRAWKLPPGEAFALAQEIDAQVGSHAIQPLAQALPVAQLLPVHAGSQEDLLRRIGSIVLIAEQAIHIGINRSPELLVEEGEPLRIFRKERRIDPRSSCRRNSYRVRMSPSPPSLAC